MNPVLKKLRFKGQAPVLLLNAPPEFKPLAKDFGAVHGAPKGKYSFVLAFVKSMAETQALAKVAGKSLEEEAILWMAYPKGTSKKYKGVDVNRDTGNAAMQKCGLEGVAMVAIDEDWSAMRFKTAG